MDAKEFKAWFEGFCEGVGEAPTAEQWAKLKQKVGTLAVPFDKLNLPNAPLYRDARPFPPQVYAQCEPLIDGKGDR